MLRFTLPILFKKKGKSIIKRNNDFAINIFFVLPRRDFRLQIAKEPGSQDGIWQPSRLFK